MPSRSCAKISGGRLIKRDSQKFLKRYSVVDLCFQLRIGVDAEPLLEEQTFQKQKKRIGLISFATFSDGVISDQDAINADPIEMALICSMAEKLRDVKI
jgi:hypothetical protein